MAQEFSYEIIEEIAVLSENNKGWRKELNLVSWNGRPPKFDLRDWAPEHEKMGKGHYKKLSKICNRKDPVE